MSQLLSINALQKLIVLGATSQAELMQIVHAGTLLDVDCAHARLLRHFNVLFQDEFSSEDTKNIFTQVLRGAWARSLPALSGCAEEIIEATVAAYERITSHLLPTPLKCHYTFTIRDISRALEVMLMADTSKLKTKTDIARYGPLWHIHHSAPARVHKASLKLPLPDFVL